MLTATRWTSDRDALPEGWHVLDSVAVGDRGTIDHVVIGPAGVFTLNTKHHPGGRIWLAENAYMVDCHKTHYLRNARFEARRASALLTAAAGCLVAVEPIIVVVGADITRKADPDGVHVVYREALTRWLLKRPTRLTPETVDLVFAHARSSATWRQSIG